MQDATGLYYIYARYMDPELGRFISLDPELGSLIFPQSTNRYVYCANNPLRFTDPTGMRGEGTDYRRTLYELHKQYPMTWDDFFTGLGYVPFVDTIADLYFLGKAIYYEDWESAAFYGGCALLPFVGSSYVKTGAKWAAKTFGIKWLDDLVTIGKRADDVPTTPGVRNADDLGGTATFFRGMDTGSELHHWAPREHSWYFTMKRIDIDVHTERLYRDVHKIMHGKRIGPDRVKYLDLNEDWAKWISENMGASRGRVIDQIGAFRSNYLSHFDI